MECTEEVFLAKKIHGDGAKVIKVGEVNATTVEDEHDIAKFKDYKPSQLAEPKKPKVANAPQSGARIFASPLARKLANDHNVPLSKIKGTGSDGTIVQADIEDYLAFSGKGISAPPTSKPKDKATEAGINYTDLPISQIRKAAALALCKVPQCNSSWTDEYIRQYHSVNVAMQTEHGLFVPVVRDADKKGLSKIADEVKSFTQKAKENSLKPEDYEGGTFTVSNLGGTYWDQAILRYDQSPTIWNTCRGIRCDWRGVAQSVQRLRREPKIHATLNDSFVVKSQTVQNVSLVYGSSHSRSPLI
ncbi:hypothetical protein Sjap_017924 [Stephania japonica]|uniref:Peripheral subunit-binding (PSBD) domain-containing protein n=1 Tax=Stephania japonica TaxID=461633 RepID=A0AAP0I744_9MAGN